MHAGEPTTDIAHKRDAVRMCGLAIAEQQLPNVHDKPASEWLNWLSTQEQTTLATNALLVRDSKQKLPVAQANDRAKPGKKARRLEQYKQAEANHNNATESATFALIRHSASCTQTQSWYPRRRWNRDSTWTRSSRLMRVRTATYFTCKLARPVASNAPAAHP